MRKRKNNLVLIIIIVVVVLIVMSMMLRRVRAEENIRVANPAPKFELKDLEGHDVKSSNFDDKVLIIVFWMNDDAPSQKQIQTFIELQGQYGGDEFTVIGVCLDQKPPQEIKSLARKKKINFPILLPDYKVISDFGGLKAIPTTFVIDKNHNIIQKYVGVKEKELFETDLKAVFSTKTKPGGS